MATTPSSRGRHLLEADRIFATGSGLLARIFAPGFRKLLEHIDAGIVAGRIEVELPGGERRSLGRGGEGPVAQLTMKSWRPLVRLVTSGSVGWYRAWAEGEWMSPDPVALFDLFTRNAESLGNTGRARGFGRLVNRIAHRMRANDRTQARRNIAFHYDLGNDFYAAWLDETMTYSSAVFEFLPGTGEPQALRSNSGTAEGGGGGFPQAKSPVAGPPPSQRPLAGRSRAATSPSRGGSEEPLATAQHRKLRLLLDRLDLAPGDTLLEIGCGWGGLMEIAAAEYGAEVTGITLSTEQKAWAEERLAKAGLSDKTKVELVDYRDVEGQFDAVASVEMVEAVGREYWPAYLQSIAARLKPGGKAAIQLISMRDALFEGYAANADFIQTYIFPGGLLIKESQFADIAARAGLRWEDRQGYGLHYAETLKRWRKRYDAAVEENRLPAGFDAAFHDLWRYYLMYCEGGFRGGAIDVAQVTLVKGG